MLFWTLEEFTRMIIIIRVNCYGMFNLILVTNNE